MMNSDDRGDSTVEKRKRSNKNLLPCCRSTSGEGDDDESVEKRQDNAGSIEGGQTKFPNAHF
jgi:hypothetical protein